MTTRVTFVAISAGTFLLVAGCNNLPTDPERRARMSETTASCDVRSRATRFQRSVEPSCPNPATLHLVRCPAPGYIVALKSGTDATSVHRYSPPVTVLLSVLCGLSNRLAFRLFTPS